MSQACSGGSDGQATRRTAAAFRVADGLSLAASPTFAIMALLTGVVDGGPAGMHGSAAHGSPLSGMLTMYLLMSAFHAAPWLKLCNQKKANIADATVTCAATSSGTAASPTSEPASPAGRIPTSSIAAATCIA